MAELLYSANCPTVLFDAISYLQLLSVNNSKDFFYCKTFIKTRQLISGFLCIRTSINQDNSRFIGKISQTLAAYTRTANFTHSR